MKVAELESVGALISCRVGVLVKVCGQSGPGMRYSPCTMPVVVQSKVTLVPTLAVLSA